MNLFNELKRRNVFRIAGIYAVVGWILMQVAGTLEESLKLPEWFDSVITAGLLIGFPIALLLAWAFEMTPDGVKPTESVDVENSSVSSKKMDSVIIIGIVLILSLGTWQQMTKPDVTQIIQTELTPKASTSAKLSSKDDTLGKAPKVKTIIDASIAVLPFTDLSKNGDQEYFSDGISEEILNVLVQVDALKVASRTSSFGFKGQEALGLPTIAKRLNVRHILEGSVRKSGDMIRITAQLIDSQTDQHLWSQTFDRTLTTENIFAIQDEISLAIVEQLGVVLETNNTIGTNKTSVNTKNLDAYELYLEGNALFKDRNTINLSLAIKKLETAVELDPKFAQAWSKLAASYGLVTAWAIADIDTGRDTNYIELSNEAAKTAIRLNPDLSLPYAVRGRNFTNMIPAHFLESLVDFEKALKRAPNNTNAHMWRAEAYVNLGFFAEAEKDLLSCLELEPDNILCMGWLGKVYFYLGKNKLAFEIFDKSISARNYGMLDDLIFQYALKGDKKSVRWVLALQSLGFNWNPMGTDVHYRALTDENFDFDNDVKEYQLKLKAMYGEDLGVADNISNYLFKRYQHMRINIFFTPWWNQYDKEFLRSPHRKRLIREAGIYEYWREEEFPPQCHAVGEDDFECD